MQHPQTQLMNLLGLTGFKSTNKIWQEPSSNQLKRFSYFARINCPAAGQDLEGSAELTSLDKSFFIKRLTVL